MPQKSMAVDVVAGDEAWYIEEAKKANVTINYVIDTHVHADHYSGGVIMVDLTPVRIPQDVLGVIARACGILTLEIAGWAR
jgi:glyoxylase-like metal-dependent hydrolase (beta-lactamase superfamily II)